MAALRRDVFLTISVLRHHHAMVFNTEPAMSPFHMTFALYNKMSQVKECGGSRGAVLGKPGFISNHGLGIYSLSVDIYIVFTTYQISCF